MTGADQPRARARARAQPRARGLTSKEVLDRLVWHDGVDGVTVGVWDRFEGMRELPVADFIERRTDVDGELWVPWHRVHWFKRDGRVLWDRGELRGKAAR